MSHEIDHINGYTDFKRALESAEVFYQILSLWKEPCIDIGVVGLGFSHTYLFQSLAHPFIAAVLESSNIPYSMCLMDKSKQVIEMAKSRTELYALSQGDQADDEWNWYLEQIHQNDSVVPINDARLPLRDKRLISTLKNYQGHIAQLPQKYLVNLQTGLVDINVVSVADNKICHSPEKFGYIDCRHVLLHLSTNQQHDAFNNLVYLLKPYGFLFMDAQSFYKDNRQSTDWISQEVLDEMNLVDQSRYITMPFEKSYIFQRV